MSRQQKAPTKPASPQGETPPDSPSVQGSLKLHRMQDGIPDREGKVEHAGERYVGNVGDNPVYRTHSDEYRRLGKAPTSEAQRVPGSDAESGNIGLSK